MSPVWAQVVYEPKEAPSKINGVEFTTELKLNDQAQTAIRVYWKPGGLCDRIAPGDWVLVEPAKGAGKYKLAKTQTPELLKELEGRPAPQLSAPPATPAPAAPPPGAPTPPMPPAAPTRSADDDCQLMTMIFLTLRRSLPNVPDECIQAMSCTIWIHRSGR